MTREDQALYLNAVPLLVLGAIYLAAGLSLAPALWRERRYARETEYSLALVFPCGGLAAIVFGIAVLLGNEPVGGHAALGLLAVLIAAVPGLVFATRFRDRRLVVTGSRVARDAERRTTAQDRSLASVATLSGGLTRAPDADAAARLLVDEVCSLFGVEFACLALVDESHREAVGLLAVKNGIEMDWWRGKRLDLEHEPSGIASAVFEAAAFAVYDTETSSVVNRELAHAFGAKSAVFVPLVTEGRVLGVLVAATTGRQRAFTSDDLALLQALASEAALALDRSRSSEALGTAVERERLRADIARRVRSELDVGAVLDVAVSELGPALSGSRCFIRLGEPGEYMPIEAEWDAEGVTPIDDERAQRLPVSNLAVRERRTVAVADVEGDQRLDDPLLGGRQTLLELDTRAALAAPILVFGRMIGIFAVHRLDPGPWSRDDVALAEAAAGEIGLAIHTARLLGENEQRIRQQAGLLKAAQAVTSELTQTAVLQKLVEEVARLLDADAADFYLHDKPRGVLRCAAVHGLPADVVGFEFAAERGAAGRAIADRKPLLSADYAQLVDPVPHEAYEGFTDVIVAPLISSGDLRGVLGVGRRGGRHFDDVDVDALETFAGLASLAIRNAEILEERLRQAQVQRGFYRVASLLGETLSLTDTIGALAHAAAEALDADFVGVLMAGAGGRLEFGGGHRLPPALEELLRRGLPDDSALVQAAAQRRVLAAPSLADDDRFEPEWRTQAAAAGCESLLAIPVEGPPGETGGLVLVFSAIERSFNTDDLEVAGHLAGAARAALDRSELFEAERTSRALAQQLARTGSLLSGELDPAAVLDEVVQRAPALLAADAAAMWVLRDGDLVVETAVGEGGETAVGAEAEATGWLSGDVVQSRAPVAIEHVEDESLRRRDPMLAAGHVAYLGVPLVGPEGTLHGVLAVYSRRPRAWRDEEVSALLALAGNTSAALFNAELYQRVADERNRSEAILANIADGIVAVDREGRVVLWNRAAEQITGVPADEARGRTTEQVLQRRLESDGETPSGDRLIAILRGREEIWLSVTEAIMRDPAGVVAGRIFAFRDISTERIVEQMKSDFVSAVSHELRAPLTSIYGFAQTLLRQDVDFGEEERRTFLGYIASETEQLTGIVDALLNVARLDTGDLQVNLGPTDVHAIVEDVVVSAKQSPGLNGHLFVLDLPEERIAAEADPEKLRQVLTQLVDNAIKYSPDGGKVTVAARRKTDTVEFVVGDEGIGIPQAEQQRIFSKFYRGDLSGREGAAGGGTGLGLFIVQGLVEAMGGRIRVDSAEGEGSRFAFELPAAAPVAAGAEQSE